MRYKINLLCLMVTLSILACAPQKPSTPKPSKEEVSTKAEAPSCPPAPKCKEEKEEKSSYVRTPEEEEQERIDAQHNNEDYSSSLSDQLKDCHKELEEAVWTRDYRGNVIEDANVILNNLQEENNNLKARIQALEVQLQTR